MLPQTPLQDVRQFFGIRYRSIQFQSTPHGDIREAFV